MRDSVSKRDTNAVEDLKSNAPLEDYLIISEPTDAYNSRWFGIAIALLGACTLIAAAAIAYVEASV